MVDHTPSPWEWVEYEYGFSVLWNPDTGQEVLAAGGVNDGDEPIVWMGEMLGDADRLLIKSAPDLQERIDKLEEEHALLLEALQYLIGPNNIRTMYLGKGRKALEVVTGIGSGPAMNSYGDIIEESEQHV